NEEKLSSKKTIDKYHLSSSASVNRSKEALIQKEIIDTFHQKIAFLDPLFKIWFTTVYLK
ncbi:MAG TPA: ATP-binding protein, partial [Flavobacteriaceae bacterium]|nr:ATP-binding protein [Flavobacteriaceae bacterium]